MTRPLTCLTLIAAAGAGLYLYQEKHRAQMMDHEINRVVHATEQIRDRVTMVRAEWAVLNEPDRLAALAGQYLSLQTMTPGQFVQMADLGSRLPPVGAPSLPPPDIEPAPPITTPLAAAAPAAAKPAPATLVAANAAKPEAAKLALQAAPPARLAEPPRLAPPITAESGPAPVLAPRPPAPLMVQTKLPPKPKPALQMAAARPREPEPVYHHVYAPVVQAFASQTPPQPIRPPMVQQAAAGLPQPYNPPPFVGSALGMAHMNLAAPVPVASYPGQ